MLPDWVAAKVTTVLEQNIKYGTGYPNATLYDRPAAGKTGTTEEWRDAWFCGFTPRLSTTVWVGYPKAEIPMTNVHGIPVTGGSFPAQIWHDFMVDALAKTPALEFPEPKARAGLDDGLRARPLPARVRADLHAVGGHDRLDRDADRRDGAALDGCAEDDHEPALPPRRRPGVTADAAAACRSRSRPLPSALRRQRLRRRRRPHR